MKGTTEITIEIPLEIKFDGKFVYYQKGGVVFEGECYFYINGKEIKDDHTIRYIEEHYRYRITDTIREEMK